MGGCTQLLLCLRHLSTGADRLVSGARIALVSYREDCKMAFARTSVLVGGRAYKYGCCQCLCPQCELQLLLPLQEALQDQQVGLTQASFKLLLLPQVLLCVRFCTSFLRVKGPQYISTVWMVGGPWGICFFCTLGHKLLLNSRWKDENIWEVTFKDFQCDWGGSEEHGGKLTLV